MKPKRPTPFSPIRPSSRHRFSRSRFSRRSSLGFTFIELLLALVLGLAVVTLGIAATVGFRNIFVQDTASISADATVTGAIDTVGLDVWQIGQNLGSVRNFPAFQLDVVNGNSRMIVRQNPLDALRTCEDPSGGAVTVGIKIDPVSPATLDIAATDTNTQSIVSAYNIPGCTVTNSDDANGDGWPDALGKWRSYRQNNVNRGVTTSGYVFDGASLGGNFVYTGEAIGTPTSISLASGGSITVTRYTVSSSGWPTVAGSGGSSGVTAQRNFLYLNEQRLYQLDNAGNLTLTVNGDTNNTFTLVSGLSSFNVTVDRVSNTGSPPLVPTGFCTIGAGSCTGDNSWANIRSVQVTVTSNASGINSGIQSSGQSSADGQGGVGFSTGATTQRQFSKNFFPRSVMSF